MDLLNIAMNVLNQMSERYGRVGFMRLPGTDARTVVVLPLSLDVCLKCGILIPRREVPYCDDHQPVPTETAESPALAAPAPASPAVLAPVAVVEPLAEPVAA